MMRGAFSMLAVVVLVLACGCAAPPGRGSRAGELRITGADLRGDTEGMPGERVAEVVVEIGRGVRMPARVEVTAKGNGVLRVANLDLRVYDGHDDGEVFDPPMLEIIFVDVDGDGWRDLVVRGEWVFTGDRDRAGEGMRGPVLGVFRFDPGSGGFVRGDPVGVAAE